MKKLLLFHVLLLSLVGCASNEVTDYPKYSDYIAKQIELQKNKLGKDSVSNEIPNLSSYSRLMAPGHSFSIYHPSDSKLSGRYRADFNGNLRLPYSVVVNVKDKTFDQLKSEVLDKYSKFFQKGVGKVSFEIARRDFYVEVRGLVKKPGRYLVQSSDTIDLVINEAGGVDGSIVEDYFTASLKQRNFSYQVMLNSYYSSSNPSDKIHWVGGDSIFVSKLDSLAGMSNEVPFVTILGGVSKPGRVLYQKDASLYFFIEKSGGVIPGISYHESYIFRNTPEGVKKIQFNFDKPETIPVIFAEDTIFMNTQVQTKGDTWLSRLTQVASIISTIALLIIAL